MKSLGEAGPGEEAIGPKQSGAIFFETAAINIEWIVTKGPFGCGYWGSWN